MIELPIIGLEHVYYLERCEQCDHILRFIILWATFQSPGQQLFRQYCQHILGNFYKGFKIFHFPREIFLGQLL